MNARIAVLFLFCHCIVLTGCKESLYSKLTEVEANEVKASLLAVGVPSDKRMNKDGSFSIDIEGAHFDRAVRALRAVNLPNESFAGLRETFKKQGIVASPTEERAKMMLATAQELERTIKQIDGVVTARVHVTQPPPNALAEKPADPSVAIMIKHRERLDLEKMIPGIKVMAVNAVDGVKAEMVSILPVRATEFEALREGVAEPTVPPALDESWLRWWMWAIPLTLLVLIAGLIASPLGRELRAKLLRRGSAKSETGGTAAAEAAVP
jgi:type III secretion protein J